MPALFLATSNLGKISEFQALLPHWKLTHPLRSEFESITPPEVIEDGVTYYENALKKALRYQEMYRRPVLADDSGLEVDGLFGAPGVFSARFGGENISWAERWQFLWTKLSVFPASEWTANFRAVLCYYNGKNPPRFFEACSAGKIISSARGGEGFGYDPIFFSTELGKTFAEASAAEKNQVSHRAKAVRAFVEWAESLDHPETRR